MASLSNLNLQGVTLTPKFIFGVRGDVPSSLFTVGDRNLLYIAGHNVVQYNIDEKRQGFTPGSESSDGINFITVSSCKRFLAVCERGEVKATVTIHDFKSPKVKILPENEYAHEHYTSKEFLSCAFSPKNTKQNLMTLCGDPDWCILFWQWDQFKVLSKLKINPLLIEEQILSCQTWQCSMVNMGSELMAVVTGPNCYRMIDVDDNFAGARIKVAEVDTSANTEEIEEVPGFGSKVSTNYTSHCWTIDT